MRANKGISRSTLSVLDAENDHHIALFKQELWRKCGDRVDSCDQGLGSTLLEVGNSGSSAGTSVSLQCELNHLLVTTELT